MQTPTSNCVAELPLLVLVANVAHPLDPRADYVVGPLRVHAWPGRPTGPGDERFTATPERESRLPEHHRLRGGAGLRDTMVTTTVPDRPRAAPLRHGAATGAESFVPGAYVLDERVAPQRPVVGASCATGDVLTIVDVGGNQSADCLIYDAADTAERYSVPDTLAWQRNAYVRTCDGAAMQRRRDR